jgi:hypothetical protein
MTDFIREKIRASMAFELISNEEIISFLTQIVSVEGIV